MKVLVDNLVPYLRGRIEKIPGLEVEYLGREEFTPERVRDAEVLVIRTHTRCNAELLEGSKVRLILTATIGFDHIDTEYCRAHGIRFQNAPGCNAPAVAQWVGEAIRLRHGENLKGLTLGVVGVGHVGSIVAARAHDAGMRVLLCDPPRERAEGPGLFVDMGTIAAEADIITFHTPLDKTTFHLCNASFLNACRKKPYILNAARGAVVDTQALVDALRSGRVGDAAIDVWEGEPNNINKELMDLCIVATPHIAGYSEEGKRRATEAVLAALTPPTAYDIAADTALFRKHPDDLERLRDTYTLRKE